jgi:hypothetical protein
MTVGDRLGCGRLTPGCWAAKGSEANNRRQRNKEAPMSRDKEYSTLRAEILQNSNGQFGMVSFAITVTVILIGYGFTNANAFIFLVPLLVLALVLIHLIRNIYSILRIASYIRMFIEQGEDDLKWETYIHQFRTVVSSRKQLVHIQHTLPSYELVLSVTGWICIVLSLFYAREYQLIAPIVVGILWFLFWIVIRRWIRYETSGQMERDFDAVWAEVAKEVGPNQDTNAKTAAQHGVQPDESSQRI